MPEWCDASKTQGSLLVLKLEEDHKPRMLYSSNFHHCGKKNTYVSHLEGGNVCFASFLYRLQSIVSCLAVEHVRMEVFGGGGCLIHGSQEEGACAGSFWTPKHPNSHLKRENLNRSASVR